MASIRRSRQRVDSPGVATDVQLALHPDDEERLYYAIDFDETVLLRMLIESGGIDPSSHFPGHLGKSALQLCCEKGRLECARILLDAGANTSAQDDWFHTALVSSVSTGRPDMVRLLLNAGCNTEIRDKPMAGEMHLMTDCRFGKTAIHYAVNDCETGSLAELIEASANVNAQDYTGRAPVWLAAESDGREEYLRMLVNANCDVNAKDKREKRTPLQVAILKANASVVDYVRILLDAGADPDVVDLLGMSPMSCLVHRISPSRSRGCGGGGGEVHQVRGEYLEVGRLLLDAGYDVNYTSSAHYSFQFHGTSLKMATERGVVPLVEMLLDYGADPDACDDKSSTPLHVAVCNDFVDIGHLLIGSNCALDRAAEVTLYDRVIPSVTPLGCAVILARGRFLDLLMRSGCDVRDEPIALDDLMRLSRDLRGASGDEEEEEMEERVRSFYENPSRLEDICRTLARRLIGRNIRGKVMDMDLPIGVKHNLMLSNILGRNICTK